MRYLFLTESLSVSCGGPARVAAVVSERLIRRGHDVSIATLPSSDPVKLDPEVKHEQLSTKMGLSAVWSSITRIRELAKDADVVVVSGMWGPVDGLAVRLAGIPPQKLFIRTCGMLEAYILRRSPIKKAIARKLYVDKNLRSANGLLANTEIEQNYVQEMFPSSNPIVIPNGVELPDLSKIGLSSMRKTLGLNVPESAKFILYLGRIDSKKGMDLFLPPFADFARKYPDWHLLVAGEFTDEAYTKKVKDLAKNVSDRVHFVGEVSGERKEACFSVSSGFVLPSHSEGFSNSLIEALAWGLPSLITKGCNFPQVQTAKAGAIKDLSHESMFEGLVELFGNNPSLDEYADNARRLIEKNYLLEDVVSLYENLANMAIG